MVGLLGRFSFTLRVSCAGCVLMRNLAWQSRYVILCAYCFCSLDVHEIKVFYGVTLKLSAKSSSYFFFLNPM